MKTSATPAPPEFPSRAHSLLDRASKTSWALAETCCSGCKYTSDCCCSPRDSKPVTSIKRITATKKVTKTYSAISWKTVTITQSAVPDAGQHRNFVRAYDHQEDQEQHLVVSSDKEIHEQDLTDLADAADDGADAENSTSALDPQESAGGGDDYYSERHSLSERHLCPRCAKGIALLAPGKVGIALAKSPSSVSFCCPARKTVVSTATKFSTRLIKKTVSVVRTTTKVALATPKQIVSGRLYRDLNNNGQYDAGIDSPVANTEISLLHNVAKRRRFEPRASVTIATVRTGPDGQYAFYIFVTIEPNEQVTLVVTAEPGVPIIVFVADAKGNLPVSANVPTNRPLTTATNLAVSLKTRSRTRTLSTSTLEPAVPSTVTSTPSPAALLPTSQTNSATATEATTNTADETATDTATASETVKTETLTPTSETETQSSLTPTSLTQTPTSLTETSSSETTGTVSMSATKTASYTVPAATPFELNPVGLLGGSGLELGSTVDIDSDGLVYVVAYTRSSSFSFFDQTLETADGDDVVIKFDPSLSKLEWAVRIPTGITDMTRPDAAGGGQNRAVIVKSSGSSVVVAGYFKDTLQIGGFSRTANGGSDLFVLAIDKRYGTVSWVTTFGGSDTNLWPYEPLGGLAVDTNGDVFVTGWGKFDQFKVNEATYSLVLTGSSTDQSGVLLKLKGTDGSVIWDRPFTGPGGAYASDVAVDAAGNIFVTVGGSGAYVDIADVQTPTISAGAPAWMIVCRLNSTGYPVWVQPFGYNTEWVMRVAIGGTEDRVYISGIIYSGYVSYLDLSNDPGFGVFVARISATNGSLYWSWQLGGNDADQPSGLLPIPGSNAFYVSGYSVSNSHSVGSDSFSGLQRHSSFIAKVVEQAGTKHGVDAGSHLVVRGGDGYWADFDGMALAPDGKLWAMGSTNEPTLTFGSVSATGHGDGDAVLVQLGSDLSAISA